MLTGKRLLWLLAAVPLVGAAGFGAGHRLGTGGMHVGSAAAPEVFSAWTNRPDEPFSDGQAAFGKVLDALRANYIDDGLTDDDFYRAASQGLLQFVDPERSAWNKLLTPSEYSELTADLNGQVVGVGLEFRFEADSGMGIVIEALPGTPAAAAALKAGDRILQVDGKSFAGQQMRDMVYAIRGKAGTPVTLTMLRDATVFPVTLTRASISMNEADATMLDDGTGLISVHSFTKNTADKVRKGLTTLNQQGIKALIVDLRGCPGGSFDAALATTALFLPKGSPIVHVRKRDDSDELKTADGDPVVTGVPTSVLIDGETASGCELMAGALKQDLGATLVGTHSFGKWSIQTVDDLPNKYAMKYTIASFTPPDGSDPSGVGLIPDVPVAADKEEVRRLQRTPAATRLGDIQLQAARSVLKLEE